MKAVKVDGAAAGDAGYKAADVAVEIKEGNPMRSLPSAKLFALAIELAG